ncbi:hypothetical protein TGPRC2_290010 [Toxoplasma gondii TgCatPRC2]|uniref:Uncharacterized protein n=6 Tax=Toxoplasma gondii TaxID=5811 RepID=A0A125YUT0_TOXGV|nr:hypothetical protein TGME49_290010 [Toxoplasma gondii ME49]ESS33865.1 hypothetical protein TGVEG_290010 [Toxoplasma gondii VEG]KFG33355.1 hypothetical protein TGP89_290010 [Toxoplasma gondii p89]KYF45081.1 hypothetical protein TGARI_290010 [Toxoplasma gondii ARI]KYK69610.1 hypothetical protein TGPRC2_290010 [Toxoplasma gondii TgCatPRC2]PIM01611.1 hypothetical protein TGCOUG_290010 [Toxoplasma gondii COUG]|eukprot:XP_018636424.1 hypothetical protein TGME49_290010 [Toxoplasma gondii ME49]
MRIYTYVQVSIFMQMPVWMDRREGCGPIRHSTWWKGTDGERSSRLTGNLSQMMPSEASRREAGMRRCREVPPPEKTARNPVPTTQNTRCMYTSQQGPLPGLDSAGDSKVFRHTYKWSRHLSPPILF